MKFRINEKRFSKIIDFSEVSKNVFKEYKLENKFSIEYVKMNWDKIVGELMKDHSNPEYLKNGILYIKVDHPIYANEIKLLSNVIIKKIKNECGEYIKSIKTFC